MIISLACWDTSIMSYSRHMPKGLIDNTHSKRNSNWILLLRPWTIYTKVNPQLEQLQFRISMSEREWRGSRWITLQSKLRQHISTNRQRENTYIFTRWTSQEFRQRRSSLKQQQSWSTVVFLNRASLLTLQPKTHCLKGAFSYTITSLGITKRTILYTTQGSAKQQAGHEEIQKEQCIKT